MLSPRGIHHADQLRAMLDDGMLPDDGAVELAYGVLDSLNVAARIVLADIAYLSSLPAGASWLEVRQVATEADLEVLWWLVVARDTGTIQ